MQARAAQGDPKTEVEACREEGAPAQGILFTGFCY